MCTDGSLCVVAFLYEGADRLEKVNQLGKVAGKWHGRNVRVYWMEIGSNEECEMALYLPNVDTPVIAFKEEWDSFEKMQYSFNIDNINEFVN